MGQEQSTSAKGGALPQGMQTMGQQLQRKFAKGVQYNMKVIIKGDRNTGKSCLLKRLQGGAFVESYIPTQEIQVASIHWNYRATDDIVKVEVWDVVDKGKATRRKQSSLKLQNDDQTDQALQEPTLDADFVDVYKNTHGVIMMMDVCKAWTWKYVQREIEFTPKNIPVIILGNFRDMGEHRVVEVDEVNYFIRSLERTDDDGEVRYAEVSMKNAYGLKYLHMFFNLPFLRLQRETLLKQLETNQKDLDSTLQELNFHLESNEQNYEEFLKNLDKRRKEHQDRLDAQHAAAASAQGSQTSPSPSAGKDTPAPAPLPSGGASTSQASSGSARPSANARVQPAAQSSASGPAHRTDLPPSSPGDSVQAKTTPPSAPSTGMSFSQRLASRFSRKKESSQTTGAGDLAAELAEAKKAAQTRPAASSAVNVDEFVPEGGMADDFLGDDVEEAEQADEDGGSESDDNPMVAGYEDFDSADEDQTAGVMADGDVSSDDEVGAAVAADEDVDSEPEPPRPPVEKPKKAPVQNVEKPKVTESVKTVAKAPPAEQKTDRSKVAVSSDVAKKVAKKKPSAVAADNISESSSDEDGPVVAPLSGDSDDEAVPVVAPLDPGPSLGDDLIITSDFMDHWLDGGDLPTSSKLTPKVAPSAASAQQAGLMDPLVPEPVGAAAEKPKKKKKKKRAEGEGEDDGQEKRKKRKPRSEQTEADGEVREKRKKKKTTVDGEEKKKKKKKRRPAEDSDGGGPGSGGNYEVI